MMISFSIDDNSARAAAYLNKADVFNVAMTRARQRQFIFLSLDEHALRSNSLLKQYLNSMEQFVSDNKENHQPDAFQSEVIERLQGSGIECWQGYEMLGTYVDVLARKNGQYVAIDLVGYPGPWNDYFELDTYKVIKRAGLEVFPLSYALWVKDKEQCLSALNSAFKSDY